MPITATRDRIVLAMLLLRPGRIVGLGELTEAVWGAEPPATARGQLQTCVSRLRRVLPAGAILSDPAGYRIRPEPDELDATVFLRLVEQARSAGDPGSARASYRKGLDLWRGSACAEIDAPAVRAAAAGLDERRAAAVEDWVDLELEAGQARELIGELSGWVEQFPLRERLRGQLMTALHRSGRQADALAEFRRARDVLSGELGIEPGRELQELHRDMLSGEYVPEVARTVRCLPRTVGDFTGRVELVKSLLDELPRSDPAVLVIDGMAGSGKTTLALHLAARAGERYPDAHLYIDLRGYSEQPPVEPAAALIVLLRQLGVAAGDIPLEPVERIGLWRTELASRKALVVLDNAASSAQIADLLPSAAGSLTLVTARRRLSGLDGVRVESLPLLAPEEAVALLERIAGDRVRAEPEAAAEVVRRCGGLPLAVRLSGARLLHRPRWRVADLLRRMGGTALPELAAEERTVTGAFSLTYRQLPESPQRVFRLLGLYPGTVFDRLAVAALAGSSLEGALDALDDLVDVHLVEEPEPGSYRMHDLIRQFAGMLAADLPAGEQRAALIGALDFEMHAAAAATTRGYRKAVDSDLGRVSPARPDLLDELEDPAARLEWQRTQLTAFVEAAAACGSLDYAWRIPRAAWRPLFLRGYMDDIRDTHLLAMSKIEKSGDFHAVAVTANYLASAYGRAGENEKAERYLLLAIRSDEAIGQRHSRAYMNLAMIYLVQGRFRESIEAVMTGRRIAVLDGQSRDASLFGALGTACEVFSRLGCLTDAMRYARLRLILAMDQGEEAMAAAALLVLGRCRYQAGEIDRDRSRRYVEASASVASRIGYRSLLADAHNDRAWLLADAGRYAEASVEHERALQLVAELRDRHHEAEFRNDHATTVRRSGDIAAARAMFEHVIRLAREWRLAYSLARAQAGLADCLDHDDPEAVRLRAAACDLFDRMGITTIDGRPVNRRERMKP
ncbi:putative AfsR-family transcriptional regulator [Actinoplanes missouriensis 431]|uniref:Putative AfsR-family transcriptional regulator n=1 Tax=Actinoplanes missouriensis (strain ATCC 14538 / DSM 43046 / CBS 188.64 / JCM 3121 / NBRC 102363 / NCIMB 12654 / NRRL B-3342 / UNCC 431) TaxID=512565 RepID=I0HIX0_ACTM4|nr:AfsR/SARP family transcriptional regulator [Actinoplanes missouriensis]BAL92957.1 putative AfsR-family transcriptional regulator [Actinoplanes missouriensis 431]